MKNVERLAIYFKPEEIKEIFVDGKRKLIIVEYIKYYKITQIPLSILEKYEIKNKEELVLHFKDNVIGVYEVDGKTLFIMWFSKGDIVASRLPLSAIRDWETDW